MNAFKCGLYDSPPTSELINTCSVVQLVTVTFRALSPHSAMIRAAVGADRVSRVSGANGPTVRPVSAPSRRRYRPI